MKEQILLATLVTLIACSRTPDGIAHSDVVPSPVVLPPSKPKAPIVEKQTPRLPESCERAGIKNEWLVSLGVTAGSIAEAERYAYLGKTDFEFVELRPDGSARSLLYAAGGTPSVLDGDAGCWGVFATPLQDPRASTLWTSIGRYVTFYRRTPQGLHEVDKSPTLERDFVRTAYQQMAPN